MFCARCCCLLLPYDYGDYGVVAFVTASPIRWTNYWTNALPGGGHLCNPVWRDRRLDVVVELPGTLFNCLITVVTLLGRCGIPTPHPNLRCWRRAVLLFTVTTNAERPTVATLLVPQAGDIVIVVTICWRPLFVVNLVIDIANDD